MCHKARKVIRDIRNLPVIYSLTGMLSPYCPEDGAGLCMTWEKIALVYWVSMGFLSVSRVVLCSQAFFCHPLYPAGELALLPALGTAAGGGQVPVLIPNWPCFLDILRDRGIP